MKHLLKAGRILFALALLSFGVLYLVYASHPAAPKPGAPWAPGSPVFVWLIGILFLLVGVSIASGKFARLTAMLLGVVLFLRILFLEVPGLASHLHDGGRWTTIMEILAICGGAFILAGTFPSDGLPFRSRRGAIGQLAESGRVMFAVTLVVFGIQHFIYAAYGADFISAWIPAHLFWAYFIGVAFFAAALSIAAKRSAVLASTLLGIMFFLWVVILHAPRVAAAPHNGDEWTSLLVALTMSGISFTLAGSLYTESFVLPQAAYPEQTRRVTSPTGSKDEFGAAEQ